MRPFAFKGQMPAFGYTQRVKLGTPIVALTLLIAALAALVAGIYPFVETVANPHFVVGTALLAAALGGPGDIIVPEPTAMLLALLAACAAPRAASDAELVAGAVARLDRFLQQGVTVVEAKTGYDLTIEGERRLLRRRGPRGCRSAPSSRSERRDLSWRLVGL